MYSGTWRVNVTVVAMRIQVTEAMFIELRSSHSGYIMKQRGEVEVKVRYSSHSAVFLDFVRLCRR